MRLKLRDYKLLLIPFFSLIALLIIGAIFTIFIK